MRLILIGFAAAVVLGIVGLVAERLLPLSMHQEATNRCNAPARSGDLDWIGGSSPKWTC
jgi:hypothetical protein